MSAGIPGNPPPSYLDLFLMAQFRQGAPVGTPVADLTPYNVPRAPSINAVGGLLVSYDPVNQQVVLDASGVGGGGQTNLTLVNGLNSNINTGGLRTLRVGGPTGAFSLGGFTGGAAGSSILLTNTTSQPMTIVHEDLSSAAANRIDTQSSGAPIVMQPKSGSALFLYDNVENRWIVHSVGVHRPNVFNVQDYGAIGDGTTDDTAAIHNADLAALLVGGTVYLPPSIGGYYVNSASLVVSSPVKLDKGGFFKIGTSCTTFTVNGKILASRDQQIISGGSQVQTQASASTGPTLTLTTPFGLGTAHTIKVKITTGGALGTMAFKYSLDGSDPTIGPFTSNASGYAFTILGLGINIAFPAGTYVAETYTKIVGGIVSLGALNNIQSLKWWGAVGDGSHDDTAAIQSAHSYISALSVPVAGTIDAPAASVAYKLTYTVHYMGNVSSAFKLYGDHTGAGFANSARFVWAGAAGVTAFDYYGINQSSFAGIVYDGNSVAGCMRWIHTNQWQGGSPANGFYHNKVQFTGVVGGLYAAEAYGDSALSPSNVTVDSLGHTTVTHDIAGPRLTGLNCFLSANVSGNYVTGNTLITLNARTVTIGGDFDAGQSVWIADSGGAVAERHTVSGFNIGTNVLTISPGLSAGITGSTTVVSLGYPAAKAVVAPVASATCTVFTLDVHNSEVSGGLWERGCIWHGGGEDPTVATYCYACCAVYGTSNTEQFVFRDSQFATAGALFGFYGPDGPNNELGFDNTQCGVYSAAFVYCGGSVTKIGFLKCANENVNTAKVGLFAWAPSCYVETDGCEILNQVAGMPSPIQNGAGTDKYNGRPFACSGTWESRHCKIGGSPDTVTPAIVIAQPAGSADIHQCDWNLPDTSSDEGSPQIPVFDGGFNDLTRSIPGKTNYGVGKKSRVRLTSNRTIQGTNPNDVVCQPFELHSGPIGPAPFKFDGANFMQPVFSQNVNQVTSRWDIDFTMVQHNRVFYLTQLAAKAKVIGVYLATTTVWDHAITISMGTDADTVPYTAWMGLTAITSATDGSNIIRLDAIPWDKAGTAGGTWNGSRTIAVVCDGTFTSPTTGKTSIYLTCEEG